MSESQIPSPDLLPVPIPAGPNNSLASILSQAGAVALQTWCSFVPTTSLERVSYYAALDGETAGFADSLNVDIALVNIGFQVRDKLDQATGEVRRALRSLLFTNTGQVLSGESVYVARSLQNLMNAGYMPPYAPPLVIRIRQIALPDSRHMLRLELVGYLPEPIPATTTSSPRPPRGTK